MAAARDYAVLDFESKGIQPRPTYPPKAVGFSLALPGERKATYHAWGHKSGGNNTTEEKAGRILKDLWRSRTPVIFHNGKFDQEVALEQFGLDPLPWERFHDTLFLAFLYNPRLWSFKLKDMAEGFLGIKPDARDELHEWIIANVPEAKRKPSTAGAYIWVAPAGLAGRYANADVMMTKRLFNWLMPIIEKEGMLSAYERERQLMPILMRMERAGVPIAHRQLRKDLEEWKATEQELGRSILKKLKVPKAQWDNWHGEGSYPQGFSFSGDTLADQLESAGKVDAFVLTEKGNRSVAAEALKESCNDKALATLLEVHSQVTTCIVTFGMPWLRVADESGGRIFTNFNQVRSPDGGAATGRLSSYPNLQNIIRSDKDERVPHLRNYIVPSKGRVLVARDYSQQELRILAHFEEGDLYEQYMENPRTDAHDAVKKLIIESTGIDVARPAVKVLNFMQVYGGGAGGVAKKLKVPYDKATELRNLHKKALPGVQQLQRQIKALVANGEPIVTWGGRVYYVEEPKVVKGRMRSFEYKLLNYLIQGSAADCTKQAMINYDALVGKEWEEMPLELQIHDELLGESADKVRMHSMLAEAMADVDFSVPMLSDGKDSRKSWGAMKKD